jgi:hypothetical protein
MKISYIDSNDFASVESSDIIYITLKSFINLYKEKKDADFWDGCVCVVDESDLVFMDTANHLGDVLHAFSAAGRLFAFSGSEQL